MNTLYYLPSINRFVDGDLCIIHDLHELFDLWQLDQWKQTGEYGSLVTKNGEVWSLCCMTPDEEDEAFDYFGYTESFGLQVDRPYY